MQCTCTYTYTCVHAVHARRGGEVTAGVHLGAGEHEVACCGGALRSGRVSEYLGRQQQLQRVLLGLYSNVRGLHLGVHLPWYAQPEYSTELECTAAEFREP
jgi:hypothetical protein